MTYGFLGLGNMALAILTGMRASESFKDAEIFGYDVSAEAAERAPVKRCDCAADLVKSSDVIVLAVKPQVLGGVLADIAPLAEGKLFISIAAGKNLAFLRDCLDRDVHIVRVMPNINAVALSSTSAFCADKNVTEGERETVRAIFGTVGTVTELEEKLFPVFTAIASCSPAFTYMYIDALARAAVSGGMPRAQALETAASAVLGSAKMVFASSLHPQELADMVCSPGGTTIEGVLALRAFGFENAVHEAVNAVIEKDKRL